VTAELLDVGPDDVETVCVSWLKPLQADGQVAHIRPLGAPLPFVLVHALPGNECVEEGTVDELVSIHTLCDKGDGSAAAIRAARDEADRTHRRMLLLATYLEDVPLPGGRTASIDYVDVSGRPAWKEYGDDQILRKVGTYRIGLSYAKMS
jgi:hypothetical protein